MEIKEYQKNYRETNKIKIKEYQKKYRENNKEKSKLAQKVWRDKNKERVKEIHKKSLKKRRLLNNEFRIKTNIRSLVYKAFRRKGYSKTSKTKEIIGCDYAELKTHLEKLWESWMTWENYGLYNGEANYGWDVDHIIPISSAITEEDILKINHYTNLKPLCSYINRCVKKDN